MASLGLWPDIVTQSQLRVLMLAIIVVQARIIKACFVRISFT